MLAAGALLEAYLSWAPDAVKDASPHAVFLLPGVRTPAASRGSIPLIRTVQTCSPSRLMGYITSGAFCVLELNLKLAAVRWQCAFHLWPTVCQHWPPGVVATLAEAFKAAQRVQAAELARRLSGFALSLGVLPAAASSSLARRLLVKLATRMALALLPPTPAAWRRTTRVAALHATLAKGPQAAGGPAAAGSFSATGTDSVGAPPAAAPDSIPDGSQAAPASPPPHAQDASVDHVGQSDETRDDAPPAHIADEVEDIAGELLQALRDPDTVVRWVGHPVPESSQLWSWDSHA